MAVEPTGDRPSAHGAILGEALADLAKAGAVGTDLLSAMCATCAFRDGGQPNQTAGTGMDALNIVLGIDDAEFGCHHGLKDGKPTRLCAGALAAKQAPFPVLKSIVSTLKQRLTALDGPDHVRAEFDEWVKRHDPEGRLDVYQQARLFARQQSADPAQGGSY